MVTGMEQLALPVTHCKVRRCDQTVVGSSITGTGHVCRQHNLQEWGEALRRSREPYYRGVGSALLADARASGVAA